MRRVCKLILKVKSQLVIFSVQPTGGFNSSKKKNICERQRVRKVLLGAHRTAAQCVAHVVYAESIVLAQM